MGDGERYGLRIRWSHEGRDHGAALETAGGIRKALPWLAQTFWVVSGDVFVPQMRYDTDPARHLSPAGAQACLWMVPNATHHPDGDFGWAGEGQALSAAKPRMTWGSVGVFSRALFEGLPLGEPMRLRPVLEEALARGSLLGRSLPGSWVDVGTPERLQQACALAERLEDAL